MVRKENIQVKVIFGPDKKKKKKKAIPKDKRFSKKELKEIAKARTIKGRFKKFKQTRAEEVKAFHLKRDSLIRQKRADARKRLFSKAQERGKARATRRVGTKRGSIKKFLKAADKRRRTFKRGSFRKHGVGAQARDVFG